MTALCLTGTALAATPSEIEHNRVLAKQQVDAIFPSWTRTMMLKVVKCETGGIYNTTAHNRSGASGYFQILSSHDGSTFSYNGISVTVDSDRLFDPHYNTLVAYCMSEGGKSLSPWYSSRGCWG